MVLGDNRKRSSYRSVKAWKEGKIENRIAFVSQVSCISTRNKHEQFFEDLGFCFKGGFGGMWEAQIHSRWRLSSDLYLDGLRETSG